MSDFTIDPGAWKEADPNLSFPVYDMGWYAVTLKGAEQAETSTGKPYLKIKWSIDDGPVQEDEKDIIDKTVTDMIFFKDFSNPGDFGVRKLKSLILASGVDLGRGKNAYGLDSIADKLLEAEPEVIVYLTRQYRQKKVYNEGKDAYEYVDDPESGEENRVTRYDIIEKKEAYL